MLVDRWPVSDALALFREETPDDKLSEQYAKEFVRLQEDLPLTITQITDYINKYSGRIGISRSLKLYWSN